MKTCEGLLEHAREGLRTLLICQRKLSQPEYDEWAAKLRHANETFTGETGTIRSPSIPLDYGRTTCIFTIHVEAAEVNTVSVQDGTSINIM